MPRARAVSTMLVLAVLCLALPGGCGDQGDGATGAGGGSGAADEPTTTAAASTTEPPEAGGGCLVDEEVVARIAGEEVVGSGPRLGTVVRGSSRGDVRLEDEGCGFELASGGRVTVAEVVDTDDASAVDSFEQLQALGGGDPVTDLGDSAVLLDDDTLYIRVGDRIVVLKADGDTIGSAVLVALAGEVLAVDAG